MSDEIKAGDVVMLKSGGPTMTVTSVGDYYGTLSVWCAWFDAKKECNGTFNILALQMAS